jgi:hypothetical protein
MLSRNSYALDEMAIFDFQRSHSLTDWRFRYDTKIHGGAGPVETYDIALASIGFSADADYASNTVVVVQIEATPGGDVHTVTISDSDVFSSASTGGNFTLTLGSCAISRAAGTLRIVTEAATDDLAAGSWMISAFILEAGSYKNFGLAGMHGWDSQPGGNPDAKWDDGRGQLIIPPSADMTSEVIYSQALWKGAGLSWPTTVGGFMVATLVSPSRHFKDNMRAFYSNDPDPTRVVSEVPTPMGHETAVDLLGDTWSLWTLPQQLAGSTEYLTLLFDFGSAGPARTESSLFQGFAVGLK